MEMRKKAEVENSLLALLREYELHYPELANIFGVVSAPKQWLFERLSKDYGINRETFERIVLKLMEKGIIYEPRQNFLARS